MIENSKQYEVSQQQLAKLQEGLRTFPENPSPGVHPKLHEASKQGLISLVERIKEEIAQYEASLHFVVKDRAGYGETIPRLTCYSERCKYATLLRHSWMNDAIWAEQLAQFKCHHPFETAMTWEEYKSKRASE